MIFGTEGEALMMVIMMIEVMTMILTMILLIAMVSMTMMILMMMMVIVRLMPLLLVIVAIMLIVLQFSWVFLEFIIRELTENKYCDLQILRFTFSGRTAGDWSFPERGNHPSEGTSE